MRPGSRHSGISRAASVAFAGTADERGRRSHAMGTRRILRRKVVFHEGGCDGGRAIPAARRLWRGAVAPLP